MDQNVFPVDIKELCNLVRKRNGIQRLLSVTKIQSFLNHYEFCQQVDEHFEQFLKRTDNVYIFSKGDFKNRFKIFVNDMILQFCKKLVCKILKALH